MLAESQCLWTAMQCVREDSCTYMNARWFREL